MSPVSDHDDDARIIDDFPDRVVDDASARIVDDATVRVIIGSSGGGPR